MDENDFSSDNYRIGDELLKVATCVVAEEHEKLLSMLPSDIQVMFNQVSLIEILN